MATTTNMGLTKWPNLSDTFNHTALAATMDLIDTHDHTSGKGVKVGVGGLANLTVGSAQLQDNAVITSKLSDASVTAAKAASSLLLAVNPAGSSPYFRAYRAATHNYSNGDTIVFDNETDPNGWYNNATGVFSPPVAGTFRLTWMVLLGVILATDKSMNTQLQTSTYVYRGTSQAQRSTFSPLSSFGSTLVPFNGTTDAAHVILGTDSGTSQAIGNGPGATWFEAEYIGV